MWQETLLQNFVKLEVNLTFFAPWLPWQRSPFWIFSTPQKLPHTTVDILTKFHEVWWKESKYFLIPPFCFYDNCGKVCPTDSNCFGSSRSTRCGCCSLQVWSISVRRVTCYDHFCVFQIFSSVLKLQKVYSTRTILVALKPLCLQKKDQNDDRLTS